jgi:hypothetical protein
MRRKDLTGLRFGLLTVLHFTKNDSNQKALWLCQCYCGNTTEARTSDLIKGDYKSCGCLKKKGFNHSHGLRKHPAYNSWRGMKDRCYNPNNNRYEYYGAKGIGVCAEWLDDPAAFIKWALSNGWGEGLQIHRKDNFLWYTPDNCEFKTASDHAVITNNERWNKV